MFFIDLCIVHRNKFLIDDLQQATFYLLNIINENSWSPHSRWLVIAGRKVVPGSIYQVAVQNIHMGADEKMPLVFRATLTHNGAQRAAGKVLLQPGQLDKIILQVKDLR